MTFSPDYPGAITDFMVNPSGYGGYLDPNGIEYVNQPRAIVLHTPEERADNYESTPVYFSQPGVAAGTHYYLDNDADVYQMLPEHKCPYANGTTGSGPRPNRTWKGKFGAWPPWAVVGRSLNCQTVSIEIEGFASSIGQTLNDTQFAVLVTLIKNIAGRYNIPLDRDHIIGHFELATDRTDPGDTFPWDRLMVALQGEDDMPIDITKVRIVPLDNASQVRWTDIPDERDIVTQFALLNGVHEIASGEVVSRVRLVVDE